MKDFLAMVAVGSVLWVIGLIVLAAIGIGLYSAYWALVAL